MIARQVYIIKDKKQPVSFLNVRPITIQPLFLKIIDAVIDARINFLLSKENNNLQPTQIGFRKGLGTEINLNRVNQIIKTNYDKLEKKEIEDPWLLFIDFKGAFNSVNHDILFKKLRKKGLSEGTINLIKYLYRTIAF